MKHYVKDSSNSLDSIRERVALTILVDFISITRENNNNNNNNKEMFGQVYETRT